MKQIFTLLAGLILAFTGAAQTYTLDLGSSFSPSWVAGGTSGTANNIGGSGVNCTLGMVLTGTGSFNAPYPRVNNNNSNGADFVVQGSTDALEIDVNFGNKTSYVDVTYTFSAAVQNVNFSIADIDRPGGGSPWTYVDQITVSGNGPAGAVTPTLSKYNGASTIFNIVGNVGTANTGAGGNNVPSLTQNSPDQDGTMIVDFAGNAVTSITIRYTTLNSALVNNNPGLQAIALGNVTFKKAIAPVTSNVTNANMANTNSQTAISALNGTDDESVVSYTVATIPSAAAGVLYYNNGASYVAVIAGQVLTTAQAASLKFDPLPTFTGNATFTYTATDNRGLVSNTSTFTIPILTALPVTLTNFAASWINNIVALNWTTEQELNSDKFIVEKSTDGSNWQVLNIVAASGNSMTLKKYTTTDEHPNTVNYYRLKQVDINGIYVYSKVIRMNAEGTVNAAIRVFPNPAVANATVSVTSTGNQAVKIKVYNNSGILMKELARQLIIGTNNIDIPGVNTLSGGLYIVTVEDVSGNRIGAVQFIKQ